MENSTDIKPQTSRTKMTFGKAISTCLKKYTDFEGRARRSEYWYFILFCWLLILPPYIMMVEGSITGAYIFLFESFVLTLPMLAVFVRRMHDIGKSGWYWLLNLIPIIGKIVLLVFLCKKGTPNTNEYGPPENKYDYKDKDSEKPSSNNQPTTIEQTNDIKPKQPHTVVKQKQTIRPVNQPTEPEEATEILKLLKENRIEYFYHFTSKRNLESIEKHGGLFSWKELENRGINAPFIGGSGDNGLSHNLDLKAGLADYVRLTFCRDHPMMYRHKQNAEPLVLLAIDITVATQPNTKFSNINATDNMCTVAEGLEGLKLVDFNAVKRTHVSRDDSDFKPHQAEILVKNHIPIKYIKGITHIN